MSTKRIGPVPALPDDLGHHGLVDDKMSARPSNRSRYRRSASARVRRPCSKPAHRFRPRGAGRWPRDRLATRTGGDAGSDQMLRGEGRHLARPYQQHLAALERIEDLATELDGGKTHRNRILRHAGFGPNPLCDRESLLEDRDGTGRTRRLPCSTAARYASFTWPRICGSPNTIESSEDATRNK